MIESLLRIDVMLFVLLGVLDGAHCIVMCWTVGEMYAKQMTPQPDGGTVTANDGRAGHLTASEVRRRFLFVLAGTTEPVRRRDPRICPRRCPLRCQR